MAHTPGAETPLPALSAVPPTLVRTLGLEEAFVLPAACLVDAEDGALFVVPGAEAVELASTWKTVLGGRGFRRKADTSRPGRTVQRWDDGETGVHFAVGRTLTGAFVALHVPDSPGSVWLNWPDGEAPLSLRSQHPPPASATGAE